MSRYMNHDSTSIPKGRSVGDIVHEMTLYAKRDPEPYVRWAGEVIELKHRIRELETHFDQAQRSLNFFLCLVNESNGIAGWHLNGDIAPWSDWQDEIDAAFVAAGEPPR